MAHCNSLTPAGTAYSFLGAVNQLPGRVDGDILRVGDAAVPLAERSGVHGDHVVAFGRPHEIDIVLDGDATLGLPASVQRVLVIGAAARVELTARVGTNGSAEPVRFEVEITRHRLAQLNLQPGQAVRLTSSRLRVFPMAHQA